jgi:hypothetical protein
VQRLLELPRPHGGSTDVAGLASPHHIIERLHRLFDWGFVIPSVDLVEVHIICFKTLQAVLDLTQDGLAREPGAIGIVTHFAVQLGGNNNLVPLREVLQCASKDLLTRTNGIDVGSIEEIDPHLKGFPDDRTAVFFVQHPFVNPTRRIAKAHAAEADARNFHASIS